MSASLTTPVTGHFLRDVKISFLTIFDGQERNKRYVVSSEEREKLGYSFIERCTYGCLPRGSTQSLRVLVTVFEQEETSEQVYTSSVLKGPRFTVLYHSSLSEGCIERSLHKTSHLRKSCVVLELGPLPANDSHPFNISVISRTHFNIWIVTIHVDEPLYNERPRWKLV